MTLQERYDKVLAWFRTHLPEAETELRYDNPYQLLVAVILSAQCTDKRVNMVTPALFAQYPTPQSLAAAAPEDIFPFIQSISYPNNKARHLAAMARKLVEDFGGRVPSGSDELQSLPGVGRKTANVIASVVYEQPVLAVDTHVFRVSARLGLTPGARNPLQTEKKLTRYIPESLRAIAHHWLILHGRYVCVARKPRCEACGLTSVCRYYATQATAKGKKPKALSRDRA